LTHRGRLPTFDDDEAPARKATVTRKGKASDRCEPVGGFVTTAELKIQTLSGAQALTVAWPSGQLAVTDR
jgi:hypothetical protein